LLSCAALALASPPGPVRAAPTGLTTTAEFLAGLGVASYVFAYETALQHSKQSARQGELVMHATLPSLAALVTPQTPLPFDASSHDDPGAAPAVLPGVDPRSFLTKLGSASGPAPSLATIRGAVVLDIAHRDPRDPKWRDKLERFRACWNTLLAGLATAAPSPAASDAPAATDAAGASPVPAATAAPGGKKKDGAHPHIAIAADADVAPAPLASPGLTGFAVADCNALYADVIAYLGDPENEIVPRRDELDFLSLHGLDDRDLAHSLAADPSLLAQVAAGQVGSYAVPNYLRAIFLEYGALEVDAALVPAPTPVPLRPIRHRATVSEGAPFDLGTAKTLLADCGTALSAFSCVGDIGTIENTLASNQQKHDTCSWDKHVWFPSLSAVTQWSTLRAFPAVSPPDFLGYSVATAPTSQRAIIDNVAADPLEIPPGC
jgi:hypothetical protein